MEAEEEEDQVGQVELNLQRWRHQLLVLHPKEEKEEEEEEEKD